MSEQSDKTIWDRTVERMWKRFCKRRAVAAERDARTIEAQLERAHAVREAAERELENMTAARNDAENELDKKKTTITAVREWAEKLKQEWAWHAEIDPDELLALLDGECRCGHLGGMLQVRRECPVHGKGEK